MIDAIDILGKRYAVVMIERDAGDYGECIADQCRLEVATYQCEDQRRDTLLHETMHAVDHEMHCALSEAQIRRMATGLLAVLRQNPELSQYLLA